MSDDRLDEIKAAGWKWTTEQVDWLIAEVERLRDEGSLWAEMNDAVGFEHERSERLAAELAALRVRQQEAEAENERHRNANLVRAVLSGYDEYVSDIIHAVGFDKVPWMVAEKAITSLRAEIDSLRAAATGGTDGG